MAPTAGTPTLRRPSEQLCGGVIGVGVRLAWLGGWLDEGAVQLPGSWVRGCSIGRSRAPCMNSIAHHL